MFDEKMQYAAIVAKHFLDTAKKSPAADVVEIDVIKQWLYKIAINNVNVQFDGDFSKACEEIISRLDGLRDFQKKLEEGSLKL
ncbi:MAG: hypothetical protein IKU08_09130 [Clostridia bacterium]|nr:hypothetical protein [Clostridia bacterium]